MSYTPLHASYNHTRGDGPNDPCPICRDVEDRIATHIALMNLMSCFELVAALHVAHCAADAGWDSNAFGNECPWSRVDWVLV